MYLMAVRGTIMTLVLSILNPITSGRKKSSYFKRMKLPSEIVARKRKKYVYK